jgi:alkanesulfonate monooxygenase SsuD/methylene tetrahydromethanopterin reductase-like flavin-dependent oxidoreductase (luciferase family)
VISGGRVVAGLGPGSSERDYASVGIAFDERWPRFDESVQAIRALLRGGSFDGRYYRISGPLEPLPTRPGGPPLWIGSWGSDVGLRRALRLGDGWLASAYNTTPERFAVGWNHVQRSLEDTGRDPTGFGNGLATMWFHIDDRRAGTVLETVLAPAVHRPVEELRERLPFGSADAVAAKLNAFRSAGVQRVFLWPVADELEQLKRFAGEVIPRLDT